MPSVYETMSGKVKYSYQYTYAHKEYLSRHSTGRIIPAIWFRYELQPITVKYTEQRGQSFDTLVTSVSTNSFSAIFHKIKSKSLVFERCSKTLIKNKFHISIYIKTSVLITVNLSINELYLPNSKPRFDYTLFSNGNFFHRVSLMLFNEFWKCRKKVHWKKTLTSSLVSTVKENKE